MRLVKYFTLMCAFVLGLQANAQHIVHTSISIDEVKEKLLKSDSVQWAIPITHSEKLNLNWIKRKTSFSDVNTYIGYRGDNLIATLSILDDAIFGNIITEKGELIINQENGFLRILSDDENSTFCNDEHIHDKNISSKLNQIGETVENVNINNSDILRKYRLAVLVDYSVFSGWKMDNNADNVKAFWSNLEAFLNEVYYRDIGIKFQIVRDNRLIVDSQEKEVFGLTPGGRRYENTFFVNYGTDKINNLIGEDNYDLGMVITLSSNRGGLAYLNAGYKKNTKGASTSDTPSKETIAHEIGHLFGADHTFSNKPYRVGIKTEQTELRRGFSVMSYGSPRNFFSLSSIEKIRRKLLSTPYYEDDTRSFVIGKYSPDDNIPVGEKINNHAPILNKTKIKQKYTIPQETFFQFNLDATDEDGDELYYTAQQRDVVFTSATFPVSKTMFITYPGQKNAPTPFRTEYTSTGQIKPLSIIDKKGLATFWLGVSDSKPLNEKQITNYDLTKTQVEIIDGTPFKLISGWKKTYQAGEKVMLNWSVDDKIFKNTKVRILMSDDFGKTYKYTLISEADNDGSQEVTIPYLKLLDKENHYDNNGVVVSKSGKGIIKIEVIDNIAFTTTDYNPNGGGFTIESNGVVFKELPKNEIYVTGKLTEAETLEAITACDNPNVNIDYLQTQEGNVVTRTWTATDQCNNTATFEQKLYLLDEEATNESEWVNETLEIATDECQYSLSKEHNLSKKGLMSPTIIEINGEKASLESLAGVVPKTGENQITWEFTDENGHRETHIQKIIIDRGACYMPAAVGLAKPSEVLISTLNNDNTTKKNGLLVLESSDKGLVLTIIPKGESINVIPNPIAGMLVFDENEKCLKLYNGSKWGCIKQKAIQK